MNQLKKTLLQAIREYGIFDVKEVINTTDTSRETLTNWLKNKPKLFEIVCIGVKTKNLKDKI